MSSFSGNFGLWIQTGNQFTGREENCVVVMCMCVRVRVSARV